MDHDPKVTQARERFRARLLLDGWTGIPYFREGSEARIDMPLADARSLGIDLSLVLCDLDDFGAAINGEYGHPIGDDVLIAVGAALTAMGGPNDIVMRGEGDGFKTVMFGTGLTAATAWAERARDGLRYVEVHPVSSAITASFGVATAVETDTGTSLYLRADDAMYRAKDLGRDRVYVASP